MSLAVKEEPGSAVADHGHTVLRIKDETEWSEGVECAEKEPRCVMQESAGALGSWLLCDRIISLCAPPRESSCAMLRDHAYVSTEYPHADECVKTEPSCWASECADACADYAVKEELVLGPECARGECFSPSESSAEYVRALAVGAGPAQEPRGEKRSLRRCSVRLERVPHRGVPPARVRGSDRDTPARAQGDSDIGDEIYTTIDYGKDPICDVCGRNFALKSDLMRHVVVHNTPAGAEQDEGSGDENDELPRFLWRWARLVPRECRVRLERCDAPRGAATRPRRYEPPPQTRETFLHNWEQVHLEKYEAPNISQVIHKRTYRTNTRFSCECKKEFSTLSNLLAHIRIETGDATFSCKICKRKFGLLGTLKRHTITHTGETPFSCEICKRKFNTLGSLRRHKLIVHESTYKYTTSLPQVTQFCEICNKQFACSSALRVHKRVHTGEKPFFCGVCKQRFTQSNDLKAHKQIHTGENPYRCEICEKKFRRLTDLYRHKRVHTGEKPHCCKKCGKKFNRLCRLTEHIRIHTGEKPFCCEICSKLFSCYDVLKSHKRIHENEAHRKRGRPRKRRTSSRVSERDDTDRKDSNDEKTRDRDVWKKETDCADHKQVGGQVDDETNPHDTNGRELDQSDSKVAMFNP